MLNQEMILAARINDNSKIEYYITTYTWNVLDEDIVIADPFQIEFEEPNISESELKAKAISTLVDKQNRIMEEAFETKKSLQAKIDDLLCIENKPKAIKIYKTSMFYAGQTIHIMFNYYSETKDININEILNEDNESIIDGYLGEYDVQETIELHCWEYLEGVL